MIPIRPLSQIIFTSVFALFWLAGSSACAHLGTVPGELAEQQDISIYDIQSMREDPTLFTMWVLYDPIAPPSQDVILSKIKYECDKFCIGKGYYGYFIENSYDYELGKGMQIEVRFFGLKWDFDQYMRSHKN